MLTRRLGEIFAWIIGWDLTLEYAMGASTVSSGWSNHFIELLDIFNIKMPLWLAYDHWTGLRTAQGIIARQMAQASDSGSLVPGTQAFLEKVGVITAAASPELQQRAHDLLNAPHIFGVEIGFQFAGVSDCACDYADPDDWDSGERAVQFGHRRDQGGGRAFCNRPRLYVREQGQLGFGLDQLSRPSVLPGISSAAAYVFFAYIGFDAVSTTAQEAKNPQRDLPIGIIASLLVCTVLYIAVASVLTGMVPWREINIEALRSRAHFLDRGLTTASHIITLGALWPG